MAPCTLIQAIYSPPSLALHPFSSFSSSAEGGVKEKFFLGEERAAAASSSTTSCLGCKKRLFSSPCSSSPREVSPLTFCCHSRQKRGRLQQLQGLVHCPVEEKGGFFLPPYLSDGEKYLVIFSPKRRVKQKPSPIYKILQ